MKIGWNIQELIIVLACVVCLIGCGDGVRDYPSTRHVEKVPATTSEMPKYAMHVALATENSSKTPHRLQIIGEPLEVPGGFAPASKNVLVYVLKDTVSGKEFLMTVPADDNEASITLIGESMIK